MSVFRFIAAEQAHHPVKTLCRVLGVSRSGFHAWATRPPSPRALSDRALLERVRQLHVASRRTYGSPRIYRDLRADGVGVGPRTSAVSGGHTFGNLSASSVWSSLVPFALALASRFSKT